MNRDPTEQTEDLTKSPTAGQAAVGAKASHSKSHAASIRPELSAYFGETKVSPPRFLKALKVAKIDRFDQVDEARALELMSANDNDGDRLWGLLSQARVPEALERWIWKTIPERLRSVVGEGVDLNDGDSASILRGVREALAPDLRSKEKGRARRAENWLRIAVCWLVARRALDQWQVVDQLRPLFFGRQSDSIRAAAGVLQRGRSSEFRQAIAIGGLADSIIAGARKERDTQAQIASDLRQEIAALRQRLESTEAALSTANADLADKISALDAARVDLDVERHHRGHDLSDTKARQNVLLRGRIAPLLSDAIDALEIEPSAPNVALKRLKNVVGLINEESQ